LAGQRFHQPALRTMEKKQLPHMLCVTNMLLHGIEAWRPASSRAAWVFLT
jgi:type I restriction-modification system DNA methylase subunit